LSFRLYWPACLSLSSAAAFAEEGEGDGTFCNITFDAVDKTDRGTWGFYIYIVDISGDEFSDDYKNQVVFSEYSDDPSLQVTQQSRMERCHPDILSRSRAT
jgi:hypothetical protein